MTTNNKIIGVVTTTATISGTVTTSTPEIKGTVTKSVELRGTVGIGDTTQEYSGTYDIIPQISPQLLLTSNKKMLNDLNVWAIPYEEVDNEQGGRTATIGGY